MAPEKRKYPSASTKKEQVGKQNGETGNGQDFKVWENILQGLQDELDKGIVVDGILRVELVKTTEEIALELKKANITGSSIRKIYEAFVNLRMQMQHEFMKTFNAKKGAGESDAVRKAEERAFAAAYPRIMLLKGKSRYILERKKGETRDERAKAAYEALAVFIDLFAERVKNRDDVEAFVDLFECIIANLKEGK